MFEERIAQNNSFGKELVEHLDSIGVLSSICDYLEVYAEEKLLCNHSLTHQVAKQIVFLFDAFHYDLAHGLHDTLSDANFAVCLDVAGPVVVKIIKQDQVDLGYMPLFHFAFQIQILHHFMLLFEIAH